MDVEKQVLVIWAASNGYADNIAVQDVRRYEADLINFVENSDPGLLNRIRTQKSLSDEIKAELQETVQDFTDNWIKENSGGASELPVPAAAAAAPAVSA